MTKRQEREFWIGGGILFVLLLALLAGAYLGGRALGLRAEALGPPGLINPGFEGEFYVSGGIGELEVGRGWSVWFDPAPQHHRPEYKPERLTTGRGRVHSGQATQKLFTTYSAHDAGVYQEVSGVEPGEWYRFSMWVYQWSSSEDNPDTSIGDGKCSALVGINPWGDANVRSRTTVWGQEVLQVYNRWVEVEVIAQAWSDKIVVAARHVCEWPVEHNDGYFDDARLEVASELSGPTSTPAPTYTPRPTYTPWPTAACPTVEPGAGIDYAEIERRVREVVETAIAEREPVRWPR